MSKRLIESDRLKSFLKRSTNYSKDSQRSSQAQLATYDGRLENKVEAKQSKIKSNMEDEIDVSQRCENHHTAKFLNDLFYKNLYKFRKNPKSSSTALQNKDNFTQKSSWGKDYKNKVGSLEQR
jgi:hypothetical protein